MLSCRTAGKMLRYHFKILKEVKRKTALDIARYSIVVFKQSPKVTIGCGSTPVGHRNVTRADYSLQKWVQLPP
jgi:hypothetical protein